jgi:hypothetical protein
MNLEHYTIVINATDGFLNFYANNIHVVIKIIL